ncbi:MAG: ABC transporter permease subunit [Peptococcaceae bacterium]|nr:ABC transporter permease subunit [Peptococcaceae bacterium]
MEQIFGWPGIGSLLMLSIESRDYNVIMGITVMVCIVVMICNIAIDILYGMLDPRISRD